MKLALSLVLQLSLFAAGARAQFMGGTTIPVGEPVPSQTDPDKKWGASMGGNIGASAITNPDTGKTEIFNQVALQPELSLYKLGVGLDLYLYFDQNGKVRGEDWEHGSDILSKIWYVRWAKKGDPFYARVGGLANVTIGHGFIMGGYSNRVRYPDTRRVGAEASIDAGYAGIEGMAGDLQNGSVHGGRLFVRPLYGTELPLLKNTAIGFSGVMDRNPDGNRDVDSDQVAVYGADLELPILTNDILSAKLYGDAAQMELGKYYTDRGVKNHGMGYTGGLMGKLLFLDWRAEMRSVDRNFVPNFFDGFYEVDRGSDTHKALGLANSDTPRQVGPYAQVYGNIFNLIKIGGSYEKMTNDPLQIYPRVRGEARTDPSLLMGKVDAAATYERRHVYNARQLGHTRNPDSVVAAEVAYHPSDSMRIVVVMKQTFDDTGKAIRTTQVRSDVRF